MTQSSFRCTQTRRRLAIPSVSKSSIGVGHGSSASFEGVTVTKRMQSLQRKMLDQVSIAAILERGEWQQQQRPVGPDHERMHAIKLDPGRRNQDLMQPAGDRLERGRVGIRSLHQNPEALDEVRNLGDGRQSVGANPLGTDHKEITANGPEAVVEQTSSRIKAKVGQLPLRAELEKPIQARLCLNGRRDTIESLSSQFGQPCTRIGFGCCIHQAASLSPELRKIADQCLPDFTLAKNTVDIDPLQQGSIAVALEETNRLDEFAAVDQQLGQVAIERLIGLGKTGHRQRAATELIVLCLKSFDRVEPTLSRLLQVAAGTIQATKLVQGRGMQTRVVDGAGGFQGFGEERLSLGQATLIDEKTAERSTRKSGVGGLGDMHIDDGERLAVASLRLLDIAPRLGNLSHGEKRAADRPRPGHASTLHCQSFGKCRLRVLVKPEGF